MRAVWFPDFGSLPAGLPDVREWVLFSFPHEPGPRGARRILSSGTWGLHSAGRLYARRRFDALAHYYLRHDALCNTGWRMMPDEYLRPHRTARNLEEWRRCWPGLAVVPIIQMAREKHVDCYLVKRQVQQYAEAARCAGCICISNPAFHGLEWRDELAWCVEQVRAALPDVWIHVLGAGWGPGDIWVYSRVPGLDSVDTITYYADAQRGVMWDLYGRRRAHARCPCPACQSGVVGWEALAMHNAWVAQEVVRECSSQ